MPAQEYPVLGRSYRGEDLTPPDLENYVVFLRLDTRAPDYEVPVIGLPHPNKQDFLDFKFSTIGPDTDGDGKRLHFYIKDRVNDNRYNFTIQSLYGSERFPTFFRTYVLLREGYVPLTVGSADPGFTPESLVAPNLEFPVPILTGAVLAEPEKVIRSNNPVLDSMYLLVERRYDVIPDVGVAADLADLKIYGYKVSFPYADINFPRVEWKLRCTSDTEIQPLTLPNAACPIAGYTSLVLIGQEKDHSDKVGVTRIRVYEIVPGPAIFESDWEPSQELPVYMTKQIVATASAPANAEAMLTEISGFNAVKVLTSIVAGLATTSTVHGFAINDTIYFDTLGTPVNISAGTQTAGPFYYVLTVPTTSTFTFSAISKGGAAATTASAASGNVRSRKWPFGTVIDYRPLNMDHLRTIQIVSKVPTTGVDWLEGAADKVYYGTVNHSFPNEMRIAPTFLRMYAESIGTTAFAEDWALYIPQIHYGYSGPCKARITERRTFFPTSAAFQAGLAASFTLTPIISQAHVIPFGYAHAFGTNVGAVIRMFPIPETIHPAMTLTVGGTYASLGTAPTDIVLPATNPVRLVNGTWITKMQEPDLSRFGLWRYRIIEVQVISDANSGLASLTVSTGTLSPVFSPANLTYAAAVANAVTTVTVTPTIIEVGSTIKVNGTTVASGVASGAISLSVGTNLITTVVTATDAKTTTYLLIVTRAP